MQSWFLTCALSLSLPTHTHMHAHIARQKYAGICGWVSSCPDALIPQETVHECIILLFSPRKYWVWLSVPFSRPVPWALVFLEFGLCLSVFFVKVWRENSGTVASNPPAFCVVHERRANMFYGSVMSWKSMKAKCKLFHFILFERSLVQLHQKRNSV